MPLSRRREGRTARCRSTASPLAPVPAGECAGCRAGVRRCRARSRAPIPGDARAISCARNRRTAGGAGTAQRQRTSGVIDKRMPERLLEVLQLPGGRGRGYPEIGGGLSHRARPAKLVEYLEGAKADALADHLRHGVAPIRESVMSVAATLCDRPFAVASTGAGQDSTAPVVPKAIDKRSLQGQSRRPRRGRYPRHRDRGSRSPRAGRGHGRGARSSAIQEVRPSGRGGRSTRNRGARPYSRRNARVKALAFA